jgi:hypothetical protein
VFKLIIIFIIARFSVVPCIIKMDKLRILRWVKRVVHMGEMKNSCKTLVGESKGIGQLWRHRRRWECNMRCKDPGYGPAVGSSELGNEVAGSIKFKETLDRLSNYQHLQL